MTILFFFFNDTATTEIYTLSLHDALPIWSHRIWKSLSDLAGTDEYVHGGTPLGLLRALTNALVRRRRQPTLAELEEVYRDVSSYASEIKRRLRTRSVFEARAFRELVAAAH